MTWMPNPALMSHAELDEAIESQMSARPMGSPYADLLHDEFERRTAGAMIDVADDYPTTSANLYDYATDELIGVATAEQAEASYAAGDEGAIAIDVETGEVVAQHERCRTVRTVYVAE